MNDRSAGVALYQERVRVLTAENRRLTEELATERQANREARRKLSVQLNEGLTPELLTLRREVSRWRTRAQAAEARLIENVRSPR